MLFTELKTQNNGLTLYHTTLLASSLQGADPWSIASAIGITVMDLGSVNAPPPLDHRLPGVGWSCLCCWAGPAFWHETSSGTSGGGFRQPLKCCDSITATSKRAQRASKSYKPQAASLTTCPGYDRMNLERINYER